MSAPDGQQRDGEVWGQLILGLKQHRRDPALGERALKPPPVKKCWALIPASLNFLHICEIDDLSVLSQSSY